MRLLKDCIKIGNKTFNDTASDPKIGVLNIVRNIVFERRDENPTEYGKQFFLTEINIKQRGGKYKGNYLY